MGKSSEAFRTISEVADWLDTPAHVLRFWESKFSQIKPVKRAGGRRYYRPSDMLLLSGIKHLLHEQGMTIKGAQKLLRSEGVKHVATLGKQLDDSPAMRDVTPKETAPAEQVSPAAPEATSVPDAPSQPELVARTEAEATEAPDQDPAPQPEAEAEPAAAQDDDNWFQTETPAPAAPPAPARILPELPASGQAAQPGILHALSGAKNQKLRADRAQLAPLVAALSAARDHHRFPAR